MASYSAVGQGVMATKNGGSSITISHGAHSIGDLLVIFVCARTFGGTITTPSGWDILAQSADTSFSVFGKKAAVSPEPDVIVPISGSTVGMGFSFTLACDTGWPDFAGNAAAIVIDKAASNSSSGNTGTWYPALTQSRTDVVKIAGSKKPTATTNTATAVSITAGWDAAAVYHYVNAGNGVILAIQSDSTPANNADISEVITGNTEAINTLGVTFTLSGNTAAVAGPAPSVSALNVTGLTPSLAKYQTASPGLASLSLSGLSIGATPPGTEQPGVATLGLSGLAPIVVQSSGPHVGVLPGTLLIQGMAPNLITTRAISPSLFTSLGDSKDLPPTLVREWTSKPSLASLTLLGVAPGNLIKDGSVKLIPTTATLILGGYSATVVQPMNFSGVVTPGLATIEFLGLIPGFAQNWILAPARDTAQESDILHIVGLPPSIQRRSNWHTVNDAATVTWHPE